MPALRLPQLGWQGLRAPGLAGQQLGRHLGEQPPGVYPAVVLHPSSPPLLCGNAALAPTTCITDT